MDPAFPLGAPTFQKIFFYVDLLPKGIKQWNIRIWITYMGKWHNPTETVVCLRLRLSHFSVCELLYPDIHVDIPADAPGPQQSLASHLLCRTFHHTCDIFCNKFKSSLVKLGPSMNINVSLRKTELHWPLGNHQMKKFKAVIHCSGD